jgi:pyruvate dehydrogenase E1 component beta subunit
VPFVIRAVIGKGWGQGPTHSQSIQSIFMHFPGIYVFMPSNAYDAKAAILTSLKQDCPCVIFEHRRLYDAIGDVPGNMYTMDVGKARIVRKGKDLTVIATSIMVKEAIKAAKCLEKKGISIEIIDPRTLVPLDEETIIRSVKKTGRVIIADTGWVRCGVTAEIAAVISEKAIGYMKAPVKRVGLPECPAPVTSAYEDQYYPSYKDIFLQTCKMLGKKIDKDILCTKEVDDFIGPY